MVIFFPNFSLTENKQTKLNNLFISRNVRMGKDAEDATFSYSLWTLIPFTTHFSEKQEALYFSGQFSLSRDTSNYCKTLQCMSYS